MSEYDELVKRLRSEEWATAEREKTRNAAADAIEALVGEVETVRREIKATQLVSLHLINELEEIASYDTAIECDEDGEEDQVEADVLIKRARSALEAKP